MAKVEEGLEGRRLRVVLRHQQVPASRYVTFSVYRDELEFDTRMIFDQHSVYCGTNRLYKDSDY